MVRPFGPGRGGVCGRVGGGRGAAGGAPRIAFGRGALDPGEQGIDVGAHRRHEAFGIDAHPQHHRSDRREDRPFAQIEVGKRGAMMIATAAAI